jgi:hypothetical protein
LTYKALPCPLSNSYASVPTSDDHAHPARSVSVLCTFTPRSNGKASIVCLEGLSQSAASRDRFAQWYRQSFSISIASLVSNASPESMCGVKVTLQDAYYSVLMPSNSHFTLFSMPQEVWSMFGKITARRIGWTQQTADCEVETSRLTSRLGCCPIRLNLRLYYTLLMHK